MWYSIPHLWFKATTYVVYYTTNMVYYTTNVNSQEIPILLKIKEFIINCNLCPHISLMSVICIISLYFHDEFQHQFQRKNFKLIAVRINQ